MKENIIQKKSFDFAVDIIETYQALVSEKKEFVLSKQLLRSGTLIGANLSEALRGQSTKDFIHKLQISRKETNETLYWLSLLRKTHYLKHDIATKLISQCEELLKILTSIIKSIENKMDAPK
ncbi:MAG: CHP02436-containing protein [Fluviicola sp.]|jgi:four helix bundle protein|uniref:four helix bundle protein n=1 Tax=Fluviicola sp. TaxID=1917219 RepID=UPI00263196B5|nr:four helix bundle protein [Fluviicola sp.]MDF3026848.1 CHP02436-containing protein [Fluviicola sp.]